MAEGADPGYALGRLQAALQTAVSGTDPAARERAARKVGRWTAVLDGMASGRLDVGSRTPVHGTPAWVTLEVVTGGFATGTLLAEQPLDDVERALLDGQPTAGRTDRERLNLWYLGDAGLAHLHDLVTTGRYRIGLPEHAALPAVAILLDAGHADAALDLVAVLRPWLHRLRLAPLPADDPLPDGDAVHLESVHTVTERLQARTPPDQVLAMRESLGLWTPLLDAHVELWADTVDGDLPTVAPDGTVAGGHPARVTPADWSVRRQLLLDEHARCSAAATTPSRHRHPKSTLTRLHHALTSTDPDGPALDAREAGWVRQVLADSTAAAGRPRSPERAALRAEQAKVVHAPTHASVAHAVADRLAVLPGDGGLADPDAVLDGDVPDAVRRIVRRALDAPVDDLVDRGVITSGEVLAMVLSQLTAQHEAAVLDHPAAAQLRAQTYTAFRRRRSLLLLDLASQVRFNELPWVAALEVFRAEADSAAARVTLHRAVQLTLRAFPERIVPNPLVQELRALATAAGTPVPLVDEVAADIFTGAFTLTWRRAARLTADATAGTLYARYYDLPDASTWIGPLAEEPRRRWSLLGRRSGPPVAHDVGAYCAMRAAQAQDPGADGRRSVARNGTVLEQAQILTTQNLAPLTVGLDLEDWLRSAAPDLAERSLSWVVRSVERGPTTGHAALTTVKNIAYAWRQAVFFLSWCTPADQWSAVSALRGATFGDGAARLAPAAAGLDHVVGGGRFQPDGRTADGRGRRLLGWSIGPHWLLPASGV